MTVQFAAQMTEGDTQEVHCVLILHSAPDFVNEFIVRPKRSSMVDQDLQEVILSRGQSYLGLADEHLSPAQIDSEIVDRKGVFLCGAYATQGGAHARQQLAR